MTKEDRFGLFGVVVCGIVAFLDEEWRPYWIACGIFLAAWTAVSLWRKFRTG